MTTTKNVTKAAVLAAAKRRYPGQELDLRENRNAPDATEREALKAERAELRMQHLAAIDAKKSLAKSQPYAALIKAARFAIDVDGDEPSWSQLREALELAEAAESLSEQEHDLFLQHKATGDRLTQHRAMLLHRDKGGFGWYSVVADTLAELLAKIESE